MDLKTINYWKYTTTLQSLIGLYCFQSDWKNYIAWFYVYIFTLSFMIAMGVRLFNEIGVNTDIVIENIVGEMYLFAVFCKLTFCIIYKGELTGIYKKIIQDWELLKNSEDLKVLKYFTKVGNNGVIMYSVCVITCVTIFLSMPIVTPLLDYVLPLENASRPKKLPYYAEYGIDQEEYYYPLMAQAIFGGVGTVFILVTYDLGFIMIVQHVVGLFALVNCRLKKVRDIANTMKYPNSDDYKERYIAYQCVVDAIHLHQSVLHYVDQVETCFNIAWMVVLFLNMTMLGGGLLVILLKIDIMEDFIRYNAVLVAGLVHFYYVFLPGQKIINSSLDVFDCCYACKWYNLPNNSKSLVKIIMLRSLQRSELTGGKMFTLCMDTYSNMMKTGFSLFTVLRSSR